SVRTLSNASHAVECGNAHSGGKVSIGAAAHCSFFEFPANLAGDRLRFPVERDHAGIPLHRHAVHSTLDAECAVFVEGLQGTEFASESGGLPCILDAYVNFYGGLGRDHVGSSSASNPPRVYRQTAPEVIHFRDGGNLPRKLADGAVTFAGIEPRVRGTAFHIENVFAAA